MTNVKELSKFEWNWVSIKEMADTVTVMEKIGHFLMMQ
jgi:hypothetical protein